MGFDSDSKFRLFNPLPGFEFIADAQETAKRQKVALGQHTQVLGCAQWHQVMASGRNIETLLG